MSSLPEEEFWNASKDGDLAKVVKLLGQNVDPDGYKDKVRFCLPRPSLISS